MLLHLLWLLLTATTVTAARCSNTIGTAANIIECDCGTLTTTTMASAGPGKAKMYCYINPKGNAEIGTCPLGSYLTGIPPATGCMICKKGEHAPRLDMDQCKVCPLGQYQDSVGKSSCIQCPKGTYNDDSAVAVAAHDNSDDCKICDANSYSDTTGLSRCKSCTTGKFIKSLISGTYEQKRLFHSNKQACLEATLESEKFCGIDKPNHRAMVKNGRVDPKSDCVACPKGYQGAPKLVPYYRCVLCKRGFYSDTISSGSCKDCAQGDNCEPGATSDRQLPSLLVHEWYSNRTTDIATSILHSSRNLYCREYTGTTKQPNPCDVMHWDRAQQNSGKSFPELKAENIPSGIRNTLYAVFATIVFLLIASHRFCCSWYKKLDLVFAGNHYIEDTVRFLFFLFLFFLLLSYFFGLLNSKFECWHLTHSTTTLPLLSLSLSLSFSPV